MTVTSAPARPVAAAEIMSRPVVTVPPTASVWTAWSLMLRTGLRHLVVVRGDSCCGVLTDRTLFAQWFEGPRAMRRRQVGALVGSAVTRVLPGTDLQTIARAMVGNDADAVPVVDADGRLIGIVTARDLLRAVAVSGVWTEEAS
jgi:CBS domain-containing protein